MCYNKTNPWNWDYDWQCKCALFFNTSEYVIVRRFVLIQCVNEMHSMVRLLFLFLKDGFWIYIIGVISTTCQNRHESASENKVLFNTPCPHLQHLLRSIGHTSWALLYSACCSSLPPIHLAVALMLRSRPYRCPSRATSQI